MAELDPIIAEVLLKGDSEFLSSLAKIGTEGAEHIEKLMAAAEHGASGLTTLANAAGILEGAFSAAAVALIGFVESQDEATQKTAFLAEAMGTTASAINGIEDAFAAAGVSANTFERFAQRLTTTIAQQWPQITANIRTAATQQSEAQEAVVQATLRVKAAQDALAFGSEEDALKTSAANQRVEQSYFNLQKVIQDAGAAAIHSMQSVESSQLSAEAAHQRLAELQGNGPSDADKKSLQLRQAQQAADEADQAVIDKRVAQQREQAEQAQKEASARQALEEAQLNRAKTLAELDNAQLQRTNALAEAQDRKASAIEKADQQQLTNIPKIEEALTGVIAKNSDLAKTVDLNAVNVRKLSDSIIALAAAGNNGLKPTGLQVFNEVVKVLSANTDGLISKDQELALVMQLGSRSMQQAGASAAELLAAIKHGPEYFDAFTRAAKSHYSTQEEGIKAAEDFKKALESLEQAVQLTLRDLAAFASPALVTFLATIRNSLNDDTGLLHQFVDGVVAIGRAIGAIIGLFDDIFHAIDKAFDLAPGTAFKALLLVIVGVVAAFASPWLAIPASIALIVTAVGTLAKNLDNLREIAVNALKEFITQPLLDSIKAFMDFLDRIVQKLKDIKANLPKFLGGGGGTPSNTDDATMQAGDAGIGKSLGLAGGGHVTGPGTSTSDSIMARLSNGEFVMKASAVQAYGAGLFHALNNMQVPGFATGGLVAAPVRMGTGGHMPATSTLNLSIDGKSFNGLRGPKSTIDDLSSFAIARQSSAAGNRPSWVK